MSEAIVTKQAPRRKIRHRGRGSQVLIYLGKQLRFFINENDWKVLPMAAVIAALVGMVIRRRLFINMEGSLIGAFALTCVAIWNGCFNSIQAVCRERAIIKREHRSGMHVSSYVAAHMIYQFMLCALQTGLTMYVLRMMEIQFPAEGFMTPWMILDIGISMLLISYASDMMSLFISSISHTTTGAMTVMPFVLIFQLVFSGGVIPLPAWSRPLSNFTISNYGIRVIAAQSGYNELPMVTAWNTLEGMRNQEIGGTVTLGQILDLTNSSAVQKRRDVQVLGPHTVEEAAEMVNDADASLHLREKQVSVNVVPRKVVEWMLTSENFGAMRSQTLWSAAGGTISLTLEDLLKNLQNMPEAQPLLDQEVGTTFTLGQALDFLLQDESARSLRESQLNGPVTLGNVTDFLNTNPSVQARRDETIDIRLTMGEVFEMFGEEKLKALVQQKTAEASRKPEYERTTENVLGNWMMLVSFILLFALLSVLALELIDKDKR